MLVNNLNSLNEKLNTLLAKLDELKKLNQERESKTEYLAKS